jgi:hypothetical protein
MFDPDLRRAQKMSGGMKRNGDTVDRAPFPVTNAFDRSAFAQSLPQDADARRYA